MPQPSERGIGEHWAAVTAATPGLWNGEVLMCSQARLDCTTLRARFIRTDFASLVAWRDWGWPLTEAINCFGSAMVLSADGALLYGRMGAHTLNAGRVYPPGGSLDLDDVKGDGYVDVLGSIARELAEETGLDVRDAEDGGLVAIFDEQRLAIAQILRFQHPGIILEQRINDFLAAEPKPELAGIVRLGSRSEIDGAMPGFARKLAHLLL